MRQCEDCGGVFETSNSYRVHKHRFHRKQPLTLPPNESLTQTTNQESQPTQTPDHQTDEGGDNGDDNGLGGLLALGGAALAVVLLLIFGKKQ